MLKKVILPLIFVFILFISLMLINNINKQESEAQKLRDITPKKFLEYIDHYEKSIDYSSIIYDHLEQNIYKQYKLSETSFGFIAGTMGYEEEMLVYIELEYLSQDFIRVNMVEVVYENETDGYGDYVVQPWFLDRFKQETKGKLSLVNRKKTDNHQVIAITGATITSQAIVKVVNDCRQIMEDSKDEDE